MDLVSGDPEDIRKIDELVLSTFPQDKGLSRWIRKAQREVNSRVCRLECAGLDSESARNSWADKRDGGEPGLAGPIWIGRDHLDCGSVASPRRETEGMLDGSDAIADWPILTRF